MKNKILIVGGGGHAQSCIDIIENEKKYQIFGIIDKKSDTLKSKFKMFNGDRNINELRKKVSSLQKERNKLLENVAKDRRKAKNELLKNLNPIIEAYMQEKKIRLVIDKKNIILADEKLDITKEIIKILNAKLQSIKLN